MATTINADTSNGLKLTSDTSGVIEFQSAGTTKAGVNGTGLTGNGSQLTALTSGNLTGALPAISGAALTGIASGGLTLLETINTTSGTTVTSPTLNLSTYKMLIVDIYSVGPAVNGGYLQFTPNGGSTTIYVDSAVSTTKGQYAIVTHDLTSGNWTTNITAALGGRNDTARAGYGAIANQGVNTGLSTSTTSIAWSWSNSVAFNVGVIRIYGLK